MIKELFYKWFDLEPLPCQSCETLKMQLSIANHEKQELLNTVLSMTKPAPREETTPVVNYESLPKPMTWSMRKQMLEAEDRKTAQLIADQKKRNEEAAKIREDINKLEEEVGIGAEVKSDA